MDAPPVKIEKNVVVGNRVFPATRQASKMRINKRVLDQGPALLPVILLC